MRFSSLLVLVAACTTDFGVYEPRDAAPEGMADSPEEPKVDAGLPKIATATGGGYFELTSTNNLGLTFRRIADELHRQYALAFTPEKLDGKTHKLEVRLKKPNLIPRARKTYIAKRDSD